MTPPYFAALIGFLFVAAWAALGFGDGVLCLVGAGVFYAVTAFYRGELDLATFQRGSTPSRQSPPVR